MPIRRFSALALITAMVISGPVFADAKKAGA